MKTFWYPVGIMRFRIGIITDIFEDYVELTDIENGKHVIRHISQIGPTKKG